MPLCAPPPTRRPGPQGPQVTDVGSLLNLLPTTGYHGRNLFCQVLPWLLLNLRVEVEGVPSGGP
jgi:hypothetical protein